MATKVNKDKKPTSVATNLIGEPPATAGFSCLGPPGSGQYAAY
jgi:hypothetical protein